MRTLLLAAALVAAGCGSPAAQREQLPRTTAAFCGHAARIIDVVSRTYGEKDIPHRNLTDLRSLSDAVADDATRFDSIPAVDTDITNLAPAARDLRDAIANAVELMVSEADFKEATVAIGDVLGSVTAIPSAGCRKEFAAAPTRRAIRKAAATVRCFSAARLLTAAQRFGRDTRDTSSEAMQQSADGFALAASLFRRIAESDAVAVPDELAKTVGGWVDAPRFVLRDLAGSDRVLEILTQEQLCQ